MPTEHQLPSSKDFHYNSPSKQSIETPIKNALRNSKYKVGAFLEKMNELNRMKQKIESMDLKKRAGEGRENDGSDAL